MRRLFSRNKVNSGRDRGVDSRMVGQLADVGWRKRSLRKKRSRNWEPRNWVDGNAKGFKNEVLGTRGQEG